MNESTPSAELKRDLISLFRQNTGTLESGSGRVLNLYREQAFHDFDRLGSPTTKNEAYRYTPLEKYFTGILYSLRLLNSTADQLKKASLNL